MLCGKQTLSIVVLLAVSFSRAKAGFWSGHDERKAQEVTEGDGNYGVDVSFPIHHAHVSTNYDWLPHNRDPDAVTPREFKNMALQPLGNRDDFYRNFMKGCKDAFGAKGNRCTQTENDRVAMNLRQPQSMQNYTDVGFKSKSLVPNFNEMFTNGQRFSRFLLMCCIVPEIRAPPQLWELIKKFWDINKEKETLENWGKLPCPWR
jgi:prolyl 4-hydroxylase